MIMPIYVLSRVYVRPKKKKCKTRNPEGVACPVPPGMGNIWLVRGGR